MQDTCLGIIGLIHITILCLDTFNKKHIKANGLNHFSNKIEENGLDVMENVAVKSLEEFRIDQTSPTTTNIA
jgi:hypothetical protein